MRRLYTTIALTLLSLSSIAQIHTNQTRQFFFNPYVSNPAFVGSNNSLELGLAYRQQWTSFKDAPSAGLLSIQAPVSDRLSLGMVIATEKQVILNNNAVRLTFGYVLPISGTQSLRFGLSGGVGGSRLNLTTDELGIADPALYRADVTKFHLDGNFGLLYSIGTFRFGFSFPQLFNSKAFSPSTVDEVSVSSLKHRLYSASYKFTPGIEQRLSIESYLLYRENSETTQNFWEAGVVGYYKDAIWLGTSFNQHQGIALYTGLNVKNLFRISYAYEFPPLKSSISAVHGHEIQISMRFNNQKAGPLVKHAPASKPRLANEVIAVRKPAEAKPKDMGNERPRLSNPEIAYEVVPSGTTQNSIRHPDAGTITKPGSSRASEAFTITKGHHYVVVSVFSTIGQSMKFTRELTQQGHHVNIVLNPKNGLYYAYIYSSTDLGDARRFRNRYKLKNLFREAWLFSAERGY